MVHEENKEDSISIPFTMYNNYSKKKPFGTEEEQSSAAPVFDPTQPGFNNPEMQRSNSAMYNSMMSRNHNMAAANINSQQFGRGAAGLHGGSITPTNNDPSLHNPNRMNVFSMNRSMQNQLGASGVQSPTQSISPEMYTNRLNTNVSRNLPFANQQQQQQMAYQGGVMSNNNSSSGSNDQFSQLQRSHPSIITSPTSPVESAAAAASIMGGSSYMEEYPPLKGTRPIGPQQTVVSGGSNAGGGVSKPTYGVLNKPAESAEFTLQGEDFPALPAAASGINNHMNSVFPDQDGRGDESHHKFNPLGVQIGGQGADKAKQKLSTVSSNPQKGGIQILADHTVKNIPSNMLRDQYGIVGLLAFIKAAETDPSLTHLALGTDLTTLGLNLNSPDNLYTKFQSPFSRQPCRLQDMDYFVPSEYLTNSSIRDKLAPIKLGRYGEDLLFFVFYSYPGDIMQFAAAAELYNRDWRYHKEEQVWITRAQGLNPSQKTQTYEQGTYAFFDCKTWKKQHKEFILEYEKLEERPQLPNLTALHFNPSQHG